MNTTIQLSAEEIAGSCQSMGQSPAENARAIEDMFARQTPPDIFPRAIARADAWPRCPDTPEARYGLEYAYLLEFLICQEMKG